MNSRNIIVSLCAVTCLAMAGLHANAQNDTSQPNSESGVDESEINKPTEETSRNETETAEQKSAMEVICKTLKKEGTRLRKKKICKTQAQWEVERVAAQKELDEKRRGAYTGS